MMVGRNMTKLKGTLRAWAGQRVIFLDTGRNYLKMFKVIEHLEMEIS